ncbi:hexuronate transporter [Variibacter gotjawalensis]|uniref:Hexuronate transporter n=1 Tax=Variibacter gotjawalensis TaxID=1333996 RepID=A0A0S3Q0F8_9BRAD|nr:MFS transporter [Variibacter gotjawalensis]NIK47502.1 MFS family permease [Variibacter gotjawalensis]RZS49398.1 sugar phosphate permease [Variibacter gotjawalensis]BAT61661.1 hexuronate transporter [Variibacter gotjawalensis]
MTLSGRPLIIALCIGQVGNLVPHVAVSAIMAGHLIPLWGLSATEAGIMASSYTVGYMLAVPILATLTDRFDARLILLAGSALNFAGAIAFGLFANGFWSACLLWGLTGIGFGGAYMPGLKALTDRMPPGESSRGVVFYTSAYSFGVGLSFLVSQVVADAWGWRAAFFVTGIPPLLMVVTAFLLTPVRPATQGAKIAIRPVLRNRPALGYILGYGAHCFELYGVRTWIVAFWTFVLANNPGNNLLSPIAVSVIVTVIAAPASILGNEAALRFGRHRVLTVVMTTSAIVTAMVGILAGASPWILLPLIILQAFTVNADSGALTSGMTIAAVPENRGATMALHSTVGFGLAASGGWASGAAIDLGGGQMTTFGWTLAFLVMGAVVALGPLALAWSRRPPS